MDSDETSAAWYGSVQGRSSDFYFGAEVLFGKTSGFLLPCRLGDKVMQIAFFHPTVHG